MSVAFQVQFLILYQSTIQNTDDMAQLEPLAQFILSFEGGFVNSKYDRGGATNRGVTISTWRAQGYDKNGDGVINVKDLKLITEADAIRIMRKNYWNRWGADNIQSQGLANMLVDWVWSSGRHGIAIPQMLLGVKADGVVGPKTLDALNAQDPRLFFERLRKRRLAFIDNVIKADPRQKVHKNGWYRRINAINFGYLKDNFGNTITW